VSTGEKFEKTVAIMARLRAPGGCPWDREQTFDTIKKYTLEETYEVLEAIENRDWPELTSELGDLLLQVLFYAEMAREIGVFNINDVLDALSEKLIGRHPHVFGDVKAEDSHAVLQNWEAIKKEEKKLRAAGNGKPDDSAGGLLNAVSSRMPALTLVLTGRTSMVCLRSSQKKPGNCVSNWNSFPLIPSSRTQKQKFLSSCMRESKMKLEIFSLSW
jgi:nucleoside triphosphate diphosphatase